MKSTWERMQELVLKQNPGLKELRPEQRLFSDLHYDSLKIMELIISIENTFGIEIRGDDLARSNIETLAGLASLVEERIKNR